RLSARPHHVGSAYGRQNAEWILAQFKQWGWDARIETFDVLFPTPRERLVELVEPVKFTAKLQEPPVSVDPTSNQQNEQLPSYNAYSIDGDVTAPLVYVNYGIPEDYEQLERLGVSVKGAIVIARYGQSWRGIKPKVAAEHGAVGCLIYSDPRDDGYFEGDVYPKGAYRPKDGVHAAVPRRSAHARRGRHRGCQAAGAERGQDAHPHSRAAYFLCRRAASAGKPGWIGGAGKVARRTAHYLPRWPRTREGPPAAEVQLGSQARQRRHCRHSRLRLSRRMDRPRQSP